MSSFLVRVSHCSSLIVTTYLNFVMSAPEVPVEAKPTEPSIPEPSVPTAVVAKTEDTPVKFLSVWLFFVF
jgi:hypothetical protein